jgi:hypothetical protein
VVLVELTGGGASGSRPLSCFKSGDNRGALLPEFALSAVLGFSFVLDSKSDGSVQRFGESLGVSG